MSSKNVRGVHSCTGLCVNIKDRVGFHPFEKLIYKGQQVLVSKRCDQIRTRDIRGCLRKGTKAPPFS